MESIVYTQPNGSPMKSDRKQKPPANSLKAWKGGSGRSKESPWIRRTVRGAGPRNLRQRALKHKPRAFQEYRDNILNLAGHPTDPIEVMFIEQYLSAHMDRPTLRHGRRRRTTRTPWDSSPPLFPG